ncbi:hypothetical protein BH09BAC6_BH09BAC6_16790 [soil metagenome]|jgi:transcriptional regulator with XRE-family HTH domain
MKRDEILRRPAYWFEHEQNELYRQVTDYMERENINRTELAKRLNVTKGYVSQILNGNFNYTLKKWIELCLSIGVVPNGYKKIEDVIQEDARFAQAKKDAFEEKQPEILTNLYVAHIALERSNTYKNPHGLETYRQKFDEASLQSDNLYSDKKILA